jgi:outer membrane protein assembly factor BamB
MPAYNCDLWFLPQTTNKGPSETTTRSRGGGTYWVGTYQGSHLFLPTKSFAPQPQLLRRETKDGLGLRHSDVHKDASSFGVQCRTGCWIGFQWWPVPGGRPAHWPVVAQRTFGSQRHVRLDVCPVCSPGRPGLSCASSPTIASDGTVLLTVCDAGNLTLKALNGTTGVPRWSFITYQTYTPSQSPTDLAARRRYSTPAIWFPNGPQLEAAQVSVGGGLYVYTVNMTGSLQGQTILDPTNCQGSTIWSSLPSVFTSPAITAPGDSSSPALLFEGCAVLFRVSGPLSPPCSQLPGPSLRNAGNCFVDAGPAGSPVAAADGSAYYGSAVLPPPLGRFAVVVSKISATSLQVLWSVQLGSCANTLPTQLAIGGLNGTVLLVMDDCRRVWAWSSQTGAQLWDYFMNIAPFASTVAIGGNGEVYVGANGGKAVVALDGGTGVVLRSYPLAARTISCGFPTLGADGSTLYVLGQESVVGSSVPVGAVYGVNLVTGQLRWSFTFAGVPEGLSLGLGTLIVSTSDGRVFSLHGECHWFGVLTYDGL